MENHVLPQLHLALQSALLGAALAAVYDMLRAVRRRSRARVLTHLLDGICVALSALALAAFGMRLGGGEVRLYALVYAAVGTALYLLLISPLLRPLWDFWTASAAESCRLLLLPAALFLNLIKKLCKSAKKYFHFLRRYATIGGYKRDVMLIRRRADGKGGRIRREEVEKSQARARLYPHAGAAGPHRRGGR